MGFVKATKAQARLRLAIHGPSGSGKTYSALEIARHLVPNGRVALVDTERGSASKYSDRFEFDTMSIADNYNPGVLLDAIKDAAGYDVLIVDSLSHFWNGPGGLLEMIDQDVQRSKSRGGKGDSFAAWKTVDPIYRRLVQGILAAPMHLIATLRAKQEYVKEDDNGKTRIRKIGLSPEMRDSFQYEMDIESMLDLDHNLVIGKTRCAAIDGRIYNRPGRELADTLRSWLSDGVPMDRTAPVANVATGDNSAPSSSDRADHEATIAAMIAEANSVDALSEARDAMRAHRSELTDSQYERLCKLGAERKVALNAA